MTPRPFVRDLALLAIAASIGWWAHGANSTVRAQQHSSSNQPKPPDNNVGFQLGGAGFEGSLTLYDPQSRSLYVYPRVARGDSNVNCEYVLYWDKPGAPVQRQNCPNGSLLR